MPTKVEKDTITGTDTTGHEWDGIKELDTPLPRWWQIVFYATIVWSIGYWIAMPAWPMIGDYTRGILGYSQRAVVERRIEAAREAQSALRDRIAATPTAEIARDPVLLEFALAGGRSAFGVNCAPCHGTGAAGSVAYPNLNDDIWLWGGRPDDILQTIRVGIRSTHPDTRTGDMPAFLRDGVLNRDQVQDVTEYVLSLTGRATDAAAAGHGKTVFADQCASCHGDDGRGKTEFGAPSLASGVWLFGGDRAAIVQSIALGRRGVMPAWEGRLDAATMKQLTVYVHSLGGGR